MIVFFHTKFSLFRIQGSGVKGGGGRRNPPPWSERVFQIPVQIGLTLTLFIGDGVNFPTLASEILRKRVKLGTEMLTPNPNECNSTLTSVTSGITTPTFVFI